MTRCPLLLVLALIAGAGISLAAGQSPTSSAGDQGAGTNDPGKERWDITQSLGPSKPLDFETAEGTWMNVDVSPDGRQIIFDLLGDLYVMPVGGSGTGLAERLTKGRRLRHAAALQPRWQIDRVRERSRRAVEHLGDGARRQRRAPGEQGKALVRQQPDLVARQPVHLRAAPLREGTLARRGRDLDVPRQRRRGPAGHRQERLAEGCGRAGGVAGRTVPLLQQGRHTRRDLRVRQGSLRHDLRDPPARSRDRQGAHDRVATRRLDHPARVPRRKDRSHSSAACG